MYCFITIYSTYLWSGSANKMLVVDRFFRHSDTDSHQNLSVSFSSLLIVAFVGSIAYSH